MKPLYAHTHFKGLNLIRVTAAIATLAVSFNIPAQAIADSIAPEIAQAQGINTTNDPLAGNYELAIVYIPDSETQEIEPQSVLVAVDAPVESAIEQIVEAYEGQNLGIQSYEVVVDPIAHTAAVNFNIQHPRGADVLQSMSSANQYALIEAIRETLLTQPSYDIDQVIFLANGKSIDI